MQIRILNKNDFELFRGIRLEALKKEPSAFRTKYINEVTKSSSDMQELLSKRVYFGLFIDNLNIISIAGLSKEDDGRWFVVSVYTKPEYRGKKSIIELINHIINYFNNVIHGHELLLRVVSTNNRAISAYIKLGFIIIDTLEATLMADDKYHHQYLMQLQQCPELLNK